MNFESRRDIKALRMLANTVRDWAQYQQVNGESDNVETSPVTGTYDWRAYLQEEAAIAHRREAKKEKLARDKKVARAPTPPAPSVFYA